MKLKKLVVSLFPFFLLLLINVAYAQEDFTASTLPTVELCPCSNQAYAVTVQNTGQIPNSYIVIASGDASGWVNVQPSKFTLQPGAAGSFNVIVNSACNIKGNVDLELFITTNNGLTKLVKQVLKINDCYDYSLEGGKPRDGAESVDYVKHEGSYALCTEEQKTVPLLITNNENFENEFKLSLDAPEWASLNTDKVRLGAKKSGIVLVNYDSASVLGDFDFKLNAISTIGKVQRKTALEINVGECYNLDTSLEKADVVCGGEITKQNVVVKNKGTIPQEIKLAVEGPEWVGIGNTTSSFSLSPKEEKKIPLELNPGADVSGNFVVIVRAIPDNKTKFSSSANLNVDVADNLACYQAVLSSKNSVSNLYKEDVFFVKVTNNGVKKAIYDVSLEGPSWASLSPGTLELNPGQTGNLNVRINPSQDLEPNTYGIKVELESNGAKYSKDIDIKLRKETQLEKQVKSTLKSYQYYIYLLIAILVLLFLSKNKVKKIYRKYKVTQERKEALRLARQKREGERQKKKEADEKLKQARAEKKADKRKEKSNDFWGKYRIQIFVLMFFVALIFAGHNLNLYNLKYTDIYLKNIFVGYLYYILIGVGVVVALFLAVLFYNYLRKGKKKSKKITKEIKKSEKKAKHKETWYNKPDYVLAVFLPIIIAVGALAYFNLFDDVKEFVVLYSYYFIVGIILLVVIILVLTFFKPLTKFLRE